LKPYKFYSRQNQYSLNLSVLNLIGLNLLKYGLIKMALNRKQSRRITVDGQDFRYKVSTTRLDTDWNFRLNVTVQREERGARLEVRGLVTRDFWLDISMPNPKRNEDYPIITPRHIRSIIQQAQLQGWQPDETGPAFVLELDNSELFSI